MPRTHTRRNFRNKGRPGGHPKGRRRSPDIPIEEGYVQRQFYIAVRDDDELDEIADRAQVSVSYILRQLVSDFVDRRIKIIWPKED